MLKPVEAMTVIFAPDHPLVVNGTYDVYGFKPQERRAYDKKVAAQKETAMPKQQALIEDARITELEDVAAQYADMRDERMELNKQEAELKAKAMACMKKHKKKTYTRDGIEIEIVPASDEETIKVRVKKPKAQNEEPAA